MKSNIIYCLLFPFLFITHLTYSQNSSFQYISPKPDSKFHSRATNIILGHESEIEVASLSNANLITVIGSISGEHDGELVLTNNNRTILFKPALPFTAGETVEVILSQGIRTTDNKSINTQRFNFEITPLEEPIFIDPIEKLHTGLTLDDLRNQKTINLESPALDSLPEDFPEITLGTVNNPSDGGIFTTNIRFGTNNTDGFYLMILGNDGQPYKYKKMEPFPAVFFDVQPNGLLSYADISDLFTGYSFSQFKIVDTAFTVIDSFSCGNGYQADFHDFRLLENGHALLMAYDPQPVDMSIIIPGGDPNAIVIGNIIQELDADKNVIFQWRSWDDIDILDSYWNLINSEVDYFHMNSIEMDSDGNIMLSSRHYSQIIKVSRQTGEIIWKLGGKQNEFSFIDENPANAPIYFSYQHDARRIFNGNLTLFDNGNQHSPPYSRAVEYELDEQNKTATLVWEYRHSPDIFGFATGSVQRLEDGNTLVGWGAGASLGEPIFTEVHPDKTVALEMFFPLELATYRVLKHPWASGLPEASVTITELLQGNTYTFNEPGDTTGTKIKFNVLESLIYNAVTVKRFKYAPENPLFSGESPAVYPVKITIQPIGVDSMDVEIWFDLNSLPQIDLPESTTVYHRTSGSGEFVPKPTTYLTGSQELKISSIYDGGEFIFGIPDIQVIPTIPILDYPEDGEKVNQNFAVNFGWSPQGFANMFHIQIATDPSFNNLVVDDSTLTESSHTLASLLQEQNYYWRVRSGNSAGWGGWSDEWNFESTAPFLELLFPNGGEIWKTDTSMAINWDSNLMDSVRIELYRDESFFSLISDSLFSIQGGYRWYALDSIPDGSTYKIKVATIDASFEDISSNNFTIIYIPVNVQQIDEVASDFRLEQNYPNPFNPTTTIKYSIPVESDVQIKIYNTVGEEIAALISETHSTGNYELQWEASLLSSGIYFYSIEAIPADGSDLFRSVKKMILLK